MTSQRLYTVGGTIEPERGIYIKRPADDALLENCLAGRFCYVLNARQTGKSSLMVRAAQRLSEIGVRAVLIDLSGMGTKGTIFTPDMWYQGLIDKVVEQLNLDFDYRSWWEQNRHLPQSQRLDAFLRRVVLEKTREHLVIFVDEIDITLSLPFSDDFFATIRAIYNSRAADPVYRRLTFVLLGVAQPTDLIKDERHTPFNIGVRIDLTDLNPEEALPLVEGIEVPTEQAESIIKWIFKWSDGHPYLTQVVCKHLADKRAPIRSASDIDAAVELLFCQPTITNVNLAYVRDMLVRGPDAVPILRKYREILAGQFVRADDRLLVVNQLKLSGVVKAKEGILVVRNKIYQRVFDDKWAKDALRAHGDYDVGELAGQTEGKLRDQPTQRLAPDDEELVVIARPVEMRTTTALSQNARTSDLKVAGAPPPQKQAKSTLRKRSKFENRLASWFSWLERKFEPIASELAQADSKLGVLEYVMLYIGLPLFGIVYITLSYIIYPDIIFPENMPATVAFILVAMAISGYTLPQIYIKVRRWRRLQRIDYQLTDMLNLLANSVRNGYSIPQAITLISRELPPPTSTELQRVLQDLELRVPLESALANLVRRMPSKDLEFVVTAINVQREVGGNLENILESIRASIGKRITGSTRLRTQQPFRVFFAVMILIILAQWVIFPRYFGLSFSTPAGQTVVLVSYGILTLGLLISAAISQSIERIGIELDDRVSIWHTGVLDLFLGAIGLVVCASLGVPIPVQAWLAIVLLARTRIGLLSAAFVSTVFVSYFYIREPIQLLNELIFFPGHLVLSGATSLISNPTLVIVCVSVPVIIVVIRAIASWLSPTETGPKQARMAEYSTRARPITLDEIELSIPFSERIILPILRRITTWVWPFTPNASIKRIQRQLDWAGSPLGLRAEEFYLLRLISIFASAIGFALLMIMASEFLRGSLLLPAPDNVTMLSGAIIGGALGFVIPNEMLELKIRQRQNAIIKSLPDALDLLTVCLEAGLAFDHAIEKVGQKWNNDLSATFLRVSKEIRQGKPRRDALKEMAGRANVPEMISFVASVTQADQLGMSLANLLRTQAEELRIRSLQQIERRIAILDSIIQYSVSLLLTSSVVLWLIAPLVARLMN